MGCGLKIELGINRMGGCGEIVAEMARNGLRFGDLDYRKSEKGRLKGGHALWEWYFPRNVRHRHLQLEKRCRFGTESTNQS